MRVGSIYAYTMPGFERDVYVGSTQDGNTLRRHKQHLKSKKDLGNFLRWYLPDRVPLPREIERVEYESVEELLKRETYWQEKLGTMRAQGGFNKVPAWPGPDYAAIGKHAHELDPELASRNGHRSQKLHPELIYHLQKYAKLNPGHASIAGKLGGALGGRASVANGHPAKANGWRRIHKMYPELAKAAAKHMNEVATYENLAKGGRAANHSRWHIARGRFNPVCKLCVALQESNGSKSEN